MSSLYETIKKNPKDVLPDQQDLVLREGEAWVPGAYEGTLLRSEFDIRQHTLINYLAARKVRKFAMRPTPENQKSVEDCLSKYSAISLTDPILSFLEAMGTDQAKLRSAALTLATESSRREPVKLAIALLGQTAKGDQKAADIVKTLARHEELTVYAIVALKNILSEEEACAVLLSLGDELSGWGKIALMYELNYNRPEVRQWALQKGCRNTVGLSYLANICAIKGRLKEYLLEREMAFEPVEDAYFPGICDIFRGLLADDKENDGIYDYPDAVMAADAFRITLKMADPAQQESARDIVALLNQKNIGDPKAADLLR